MDCMDRMAVFSKQTWIFFLKSNAGGKTIISDLCRKQAQDKGLSSLWQANIQGQRSLLTEAGSAHTSLQADTATRETSLLRGFAWCWSSLCLKLRDPQNSKAFVLMLDLLVPLVSTLSSV